MYNINLNSIPLITASLVAVLYFPAPFAGQALAENPKPPVDDKPSDTEGIGRRDPCILGEKTLTALIPVTDKKLPGLTVAADPTLFFYIPSTRETVETLDFILQDKQENIRYQTTLRVPDNPGIISLKIPESARLQVGNSYFWTLSINCQIAQSDGYIYVNGIIQRVRLTPELDAKLAAAEPREIPTIYANAGIWHETLSSLARLRQNNPQDKTLENNWVRMLESVGLGSIAEEPLIEPLFKLW